MEPNSEITLKTFCILLPILILIVYIIVGIITGLVDKKLKAAIREVKSKYGVILNPIKMGAVLSNIAYPWREPEQWSPYIDTFFNGIPAIILQFFPQKDNSARTEEKKKKRIELYNRLIDPKGGYDL